MYNIRFIGDVHGKLKQYNELCEAIPDTVCLGEMGFDLTWLKEDGSTPRHLILPGNHDNYSECGAYSTFLANPGYGQFKSGPLSLRHSYYVRGAASIDKHYRIEGKTWWAEEELSIQQLTNAVEEYSEVEPDIMVTHTCPSILVPQLLRPDQVQHDFRTEQALSAMFEIHQPKIWVFGHFHTTRVIKRNGTLFIALGELGTCDMNVDDLQFRTTGGEGYSWG